MPPYCQVALAVPLRRTFTYAIPASLEGRVEIGSRVVVPFRRRAMIGVVVDVHNRTAETPRRDGGANTPPAEKPKSKPQPRRHGGGTEGTEKIIREIAEALDGAPALTPSLVELGQWVASYYLAPVGEVFRAMLPPAVEVRHEREVRLTDAGREYQREIQSLQNRSAQQVEEMALLQLLEVAGLPVNAARLAKLPGGEAAAERLARRGAVEFAQVARRRKARMQKIVAWAAEASQAKDNAEVQSTPRNAEEAAGAREERDEGPKSRDAEQRIRQELTALRGPMPLALLLKAAHVSRSVVERLERQGRLLVWEEPLTVEEEAFETDFTPPSNVLNAEQRAALDQVRTCMQSGEFATGLLYGVTGSGKTEVYLCAVEQALAAGRTALVLVPEIALTLWVGRLCRARFGDVVAVLHSALPDVERAREWWRVRRGEARVVVGTRSAVFAPLQRPALVIVDEEQESAYKQEETPRYHGRDVAIVRARMEGAVALLGSATPSLESFHNARSGKYRLLELGARVASRPMARVEIVDMREDFQRTHNAAPLSEKLRNAIAARLRAGTQALALINRRGYAWFALCRACGATAQCQNCSISLTYHKQRDRMACHYCGFTARVPKTCAKCESEHIYFVGEGAEQIEELLRRLYPHARVGRLDRDAVRTKREYQQVLGAFAAGEIDILVGTQMVAKGHDFQRVTLVGVVSADMTLGLPDFRAAERTFQLLTQVAGRAGRGELRGEVLVQTYYPEHYAVQHAAQQDYLSFFEKELRFRRLMHYPPFTALANVIVRDRKMENAARWARMLDGFLRPCEAQGLKVLGPAAAPRARLKREYRFQFLLKSPKRSALNSVLAGALEFCAQREIPESAVMVDVDPLSLM
jgi:primosomal protein N' (replication factor Y)